MDYELCLNSWYDDDDPEHLVYFEIYDRVGKRHWQSTWHDLREFSEESNLINEFREEIREECKKYNIDVNLSSDDYYDWENPFRKNDWERPPLEK